MTQKILYILHFVSVNVNRFKLINFGENKKYEPSLFIFLSLIFQGKSFNYIIIYYIVEPGYNDFGLCDTPSIPSDILRYQLIPHC